MFLFGVLYAFIMTMVFDISWKVAFLLAFIYCLTCSVYEDEIRQLKKGSSNNEQSADKGTD